METAAAAFGVTKQFSNGRGIKNIDFEISRGDCLGVVGPNGAGKTTLLKCLTGLALPDSGKIELFGVDIQKNFKKAIRPVGAVIGQGNTAAEYMTAYQNLKMALRFYPDVPGSAIDEVLELTGLIPFKHEKISAFSMGMKQRFSMVAALISRPQLVILDEPTNGLDLDGLLQFRNTIKTLSSDSKVTFVISSHHLSEMEKLCNRFCLLIDGTVSMVKSDQQSLENLYLQKVEGAAYEAGLGK